MELNVTFLLDNNLLELFRPTEPYNNVPNDIPGEVSGNVTLLSPANSIMIEYLNDKQDRPLEDTVLKELL